MTRLEEILIVTMEECGELTQACSKVIRSNGKKKYIKDLQDEIGDVMCMIEILKMASLISDDQISERMEVKRNKLIKWSNIFNGEEKESIHSDSVR